MNEDRLKLLKIMNCDKKKILESNDGINGIRKLLLLVDLSEVYYLVTKFSNLDVLQAYNFISSTKNKKNLIFEKAVNDEDKLIFKSFNNDELNDSEINRLILMIELSHIYEKMKNNGNLTFEEAYIETKKELYDEDDSFDNYIEDIEEYTEKIEYNIPDYLEKQMNVYMDEMLSIRNNKNIVI